MMKEPSLNVSLFDCPHGVSRHAFCCFIYRAMFPVIPDLSFISLLPVYRLGQNPHAPVIPL